jgi:hypothetical protein
MKNEQVSRIWTGLLGRFASCFTEPGMIRFSQLATGTPLAQDRPLTTDIVTALGLPQHWRALEFFLEEGAWPTESVENVLAEMAAPSGRRSGRQLWALDDTKVLKCGEHTWGACTFHEYTSRAPNRPETVRAHNLVLCGALQTKPRRIFLPTGGRLYMREGQLPPGESFRTKPDLAVELLRGCAKATTGPHLAIFDGGYAVGSMVEPLISPPPGEPTIEFLTRLRFDARLYEPPPPRAPGQTGRPRKWGRRLPRPEDCEDWPGPWRQGKARVYGKLTRICYKQVFCQWHPAGPEGRVHAFALKIGGYKEPWYLITSDLKLSAEQVLEFYCARLAQEDAHRELKQHCGLTAGQGRLKNVVLRTVQLRLVAMTLMKLLAQRLDGLQGEVWWDKPPWYRQKRHGSIRDVKRLMMSAREDFSQLDWRTLIFRNSPRVPAGAETSLHRAA